jgi:hypothetical protein
VRDGTARRSCTLSSASSTFPSTCRKTGFASNFRTWAVRGRSPQAPGHRQDQQLSVHVLLEQVTRVMSECFLGTAVGMTLEATPLPPASLRVPLTLQVAASSTRPTFTVKDLGRNLIRSRNRVRNDQWIKAFQ